MANLEFTEYRYPRLIYGALPALPWGQESATQQVAIGATSAASDPFDATTQLIVLTAIGADCRIAIGAEGIEAANNALRTRLLQAGAEYAFAVEAGQVLAVIAAVDTVDPEILSAGTASNAEGSKLAFTLEADEPVTFTISGGADAAQFSILQPVVPSTTATLRWVADGVQNFSAPADAGANNTYVADITATDPAGNDDTETITVTVTDVA